MTRRSFLAAAPAAAVPVRAAAPAAKPALLGGTPVRTARFPSWPVIDQREDQELLSTVRSGKWYRGRQVARFEEAYAQLTGAKHCLAVSSGTAALATSLNALGVGPGDEVLVPPYTFVATINVVLLQHALPVFVDTDPETFLMDPAKLEAAMTERTAAIMPVHIGGSSADLDNILAVARKRGLPVIEDACQAHLAEWRGRKVGNFGDAGCFSFQASKNLNCGDGGAILSNREDVIERCFSFHTQGRRRKAVRDAYFGAADNRRMTEFQAAILAAQMTRLVEQTETRTANARYLSSMLREIPGAMPARMYEGCTRNAYHLYMFRYDKERFAGLPRAKFLKALSAEGIPASGGYGRLNKEAFIKNALHTRGYERVYSKERLAEWEERNQCPANDRVCQEAVWLGQTVLLAGRSDMEQIAEAVRKVQAYAGELARA